VVHDLAHIRAADTHTLAYRWYLRVFLAATVRRAEHIIVVSQHTKQDVIDHYDIAPQKVSVCYGAADKRFQPRMVSEDTYSNLREQYGLASEFALFVGSVESRKNVHIVVEALGRMEPSVRPQFVVVGNRDSTYEPLAQAIEQYDVEVVFTGYVPDEQLPFFYNLATMFVYPSEYEGFGLPVLEAMQSEAPVLVSNRSSLPEVVDEAGIVVDPTDLDEVIAGISELLTEQTRKQYATSGVSRANEFSWVRSAKRINTILNEVT
jgi:glycosyltransferase involved in cell wall biosynthesis